MATFALTRILVPTDFSETSMAALKYARFSTRYGSASGPRAASSSANQDDEATIQRRLLGARRREQQKQKG